MRKKQVDNVLPEPEKKLEFKTGDNKEYAKVEVIIDSVVYGQ